MSLSLTDFGLESLRAAYDFVDASSSQNAELILVRLAEIFVLLESRKFIGAPGPIAGTRRFLVPRTPFFIVYRVIGDDVQVLAVLHESQRWPRIPIP